VACFQLWPKAGLLVDLSLLFSPCPACQCLAPPEVCPCPGVQSGSVYVSRRAAIYIYIYIYIYISRCNPLRCQFQTLPQLPPHLEIAGAVASPNSATTVASPSRRTFWRRSGSVVPDVRRAISVGSCAPLSQQTQLLGNPSCQSSSAAICKSPCPTSRAPAAVESLPVRSCSLVSTSSFPSYDIRLHAYG
jgi:hypothetical protein